MLRTSRRQVDFGLWAYVPAHLLMVHAAAATHERVQLQWPRTGADAARRLSANRELVHAWCAKLPPATLRAHDARSLALDIVPLLTKLVVPAVRAVAQHLLLPDERQRLAHAVGVMLSYGVTFSLDDTSAQQRLPAWQQRQQAQAALLLGGVAGKDGAEADAFALLPPERLVPLQPALDTLHTYRHMPAAGKPVPMVVRQLVAQQVSHEAIRRAEAARGGLLAAEDHQGGARGTPMSAAKGGQQRGALGGKATKAANDELERQRLAKLRGVKTGAKGGATAAAAKAPEARNWLEAMRVTASSRRKAAAVGRPLPGAGAGGGAAGGDGAAGDAAGEDDGGTTKGAFAVLYKFNEGYTNAVKRPLLLKELL